jgi:precorrin-6x reductase
MKNVILIDFALTSEKTLVSICDELKINFKVLKSDKEKFKFYKVWIDMDSRTMIAYTTVKDTKNIVYTVGIESMLQSLNSYQLQPSTNLAELNVNSILDKISKYGIDSLLKEEKEFLDEFSKN